MRDEGVVFLTAKGLEAIRKELAYLKDEKRAEISDRLHKAIAMGDLSENADYHAAKEDQAFMEGRIRDLEDTLRRAQVIEASGPSDKVRGQPRDDHGIGVRRGRNVPHCGRSRSGPDERVHF